MLKTPIDFYNI